MFTKLGFNVTKVGPTRINGRREIDLISANMMIIRESKIHNENCMSDRY